MKESVRPLRIAIFSDSALPILNGVSVSINQLMHQLRAEGHSVHLFTSGTFNYSEADPNIHRFWAVETPFAKGYPFSTPPFYPMLREFRKHRFDLVHTHTPFTVGMVGLRWAESHNLPIVSTYHTHYDKYSHYVPLIPKAYTRYKIAKHTNFYYNSVNHVITPSDASLRWLRRHSVHSPTTVIPTGIPAPPILDGALCRAKLNVPVDQKVLLYVGRVAIEKNIGRLLEACAELFPTDPRLTLWVVGDGPARERFMAEARDLEIGDRVKFWGAVPRKDLDPFYAAADLFTFPSVTETQGLVVVEAMSHGLPAIVIHGGGASHSVKENINGFVVANTTDQFAGAIHRVIDDSSLYDSMCIEAAHTAKEYSVPNMVQQVIGVYRSVLGEEPVVKEEIRVI